MSSPFSLRPATPADIPTLASLAHEAFLTDRQTILKSLFGYEHGAGMVGALEHWIGLAGAPLADSEGKGRRIEVTKAVLGAEKDEEIVGWVCWAGRGVGFGEWGTDLVVHDFKQASVAASTADAEAGSGSDGDREVDKEEQQAQETDSSRAQQTQTPLERLEAYTDEHMERTIAQLMPEDPHARTRCLFTTSLVVSPAHQGRGIGRALIEHGTKRAAQANAQLVAQEARTVGQGEEAGRKKAAGGDRLFCWVHASEAAAGLLTRLGWSEVEDMRLVVDLDEYCAGIGVPEGVERKGGRETGWGEYVLRIMRWDGVSGR